MKIGVKYIVVLAMLISFASCKNDSRPNYQYMPNMYESVGYESYQESDAFANGVEAQLPAEGTIPRGDFMPYEIDNTNEGYVLAKATLTNPLADPIPLVDADSVEVDPEVPRVDYTVGGPLYTIYCAICHGAKGAGQGKLVQREKILGVPSYDDVGRAITTGSIYHVIYYGKNTMGSYANQLNEEERWQVVAYVEKLKADLEK
jgi:mono/diheme cytochrome c family protein